MVRQKPWVHMLRQKALFVLSTRVSVLKYAVVHFDLGIIMNKILEIEKNRIFHSKKHRNNSDESISVAVTYGKGEIEGEIHLENIRLGQLEAVNQSFLLVYEVRDFQNHEFDGVCGLGFRPLEGGGISL